MINLKFIRFRSARRLTPAVPVPLIALTLFAAGTVFAGGVTPAGDKAAGASKPQASQRVAALIEATLKEQGMSPNAAIDDATFVRRAYLNIGGRIPTIEEAEAFHADTYPDKRQRLIERLVSSEAYVSNFYHFWADLLRISSDLDGPVLAAYELWVKQALRDNKPYDEMVYELVTATGEFWDNGATGYYFRDRGMPLDNMSNTVRLFLGTRLECAQCHNHPFDKWTQMDYFEMAAFSYGMSSRGKNSDNRRMVDSQLRSERKDVFIAATGIEDFPTINESKVDAFLENPRKSQWLKKHGLSETEFRALIAKGKTAVAEAEAKAESMKEVIKQLYQPLKYSGVSASGKSQVKLPHDYQYSDAEPLSPVAAKTMFGADISEQQLDQEGIGAYASWMTSADNPTFTRVIVNRLWKEVFGHGLIEPLDELTDQTEASHPELLAYLEDLMRDLDYDMQAFLTVLYSTDTYQRAADASEMVLGAPYYFPGPVLRRMSAEQIWDSVVALALPEADHYRPQVGKNLQSIERQRLIYESLEGRTPEEFKAMLEELAPMMGSAQPKLDELREKMAAARTADDDRLMRQLRTEFSDAGKDVKRTINEVGYYKLDEMADEETLIAAAGLTGVDLEQLASENATRRNGMTITELPVVVPVRPELSADSSNRQKGKNKRKKQLRGDDDYRSYRSLVAKMARASELESPAPRGHFLRDFGQSDREMIENSADSASVPQALNLLNGPIVDALTNRYAAFGHRLHRAGDVEQKSRMIFQAMLTREPTAEELSIVAAEVEQLGDEAYAGVVWSLLNTQQFLFVQ